MIRYMFPVREGTAVKPAFLRAVFVAGCMAVVLAGCAPLQPDTPLAANVVASPNFDERRPDFVVIHHTGSKTLEDAQRILTTPLRKVSAHYLISRDGAIIQLVGENARAWHAGKSWWGGLTDLNSASIGIELDNAGKLERVGNRWISAVSKRAYADDDVLVANHKHDRPGTPPIGWHEYGEAQLEVAAQVGLLLIDLDYFKHVNDTLGHSAGDHLLQTLGQRFKNCFEAGITVARLGGDEFAILVPELQDQAQLMEVAQLAWMQMELPISYAGQYINGGMSIGCSMFPRDAQSASNLLKCADIALNDLKSSGRGGIRMFNQAMFEALEITTRQLTLARSILKSDRIAPFYQPKVLLNSAQVIGFEALLRWHDQSGRLQLPSNIYAAFHDYELASGISEVMQVKIFQDIQQWMADGMQVLPISINAAPVEFLRDDYAEKLLQRIRQYGIPHHAVELEITEQSLSERGANYVRRALNLLKQSGIQISLDDFGTGHSSLTRLKDYPVDCIKIDRNFVERMTLDRSALAIVKAITQLGDSISLDILVEGIETAEQLEVLRACHCLKGQGFYFYRPMSYADATALLLPRRGG